MREVGYHCHRDTECGHHGCFQWFRPSGRGWRDQQGGLRIRRDDDYRSGRGGAARGRDSHVRSRRDHGGRSEKGSAMIDSAYKRQSGSVLIEAMVAGVVFSFGLLALISMQSAAVRSTTDAKYRADASFLANQVIGQMWGQPPRQDSPTLLKQMRGIAMPMPRTTALRVIGRRLFRMHCPERRRKGKKYSSTHKGLLR